MEEEVKVISSDADEEVPAEDEGVRPPDGDASDRQEEVEGSDPSPEPEEATAVLRRERDEYLALAQRTQADFENWRKRATRETAAAGQRARSGLMTELLPVVDNLERALASAEAEDGLAGGVKLVHSELVSVLVRNGVEPFDPKGEKFDHGVHEAISTRPDEETGAGVVLDVVEKGYRLGESVLRPARVVVSA